MFRRRPRTPQQEFPEYYYYGEENERRSRPQRRSPRVLVHLFILVLIVALFVGAVWVTSGRTMAEKILTALAAPAGIIWLSTFAVSYFALLSGRGILAFLGLFSWLAWSAAGNAFVSNWLISELEREFVEVQWQAEEPYDVVLLLGGGTAIGPDGRVQLGAAGDRLSVAARMWQAEQVGLILCSGADLQRVAGPGSVADETHAILIDWGVPSDYLQKIGGNNTLEEIQSLDRWLDEQETRELRIGVLTSAWHLPRAMRLARYHGIRAHPIPADFRSAPLQPDAHWIVPSPEHLVNTGLAVKEHLARLVGR